MQQIRTDWNIFDVNLLQLKRKAINENDKDAYHELLQLPEIMSDENIQLILQKFESFKRLYTFFQTANSMQYTNTINPRLLLFIVHRIPLEVSITIYALYKYNDLLTLQKNLFSLNETQKMYQLIHKLQTTNDDDYDTIMNDDQNEYILPQVTKHDIKQSIYMSQMM